MICRDIYQLVYPWQSEAVLRIGLIQVCKVYAHLPLPVSFLNQNNVKKPHRIIHVLCKINLQ